MQARDGNYYGSTQGAGDHGQGTIFKLNAGGILTTLVSFDGSNGGWPEALLTQGRDGHLYGTTFQDGDLQGSSGRGFGTIFRIVLPAAPSLPSLKIIRSGDELLISWPSTAGSAVLQMSAEVLIDAWKPVPVVAAQGADQRVVTLQITDKTQFFRLADGIATSMLRAPLRRPS